MNISEVHNCYGCGVCATVCKHDVIKIELNENGFYEPRIVDADKCTDCGLCVDVCAYKHDEIALSEPTIKSYATWSRDEAVRRKCSSGGVAFELGRVLMAQGYKVCGVRYNAERQRAEHYIASTLEELIPSVGSKYIQSYTVDAFKNIDIKAKYLVVGSPCQIDSFRRYIKRFKKEENFVLMDFFCHGVPSMLMWNKYVKWAEEKVGKLTYVSWRNKFTGWHDSWAMAIDGEKRGEKVDWHESYNLLIREKKSFYNARMSQGDMFYRLFLGDVCLGKACYDKCKYKYNHSSADIRIGDLWGKRYKDDEKGVSATITFTPRGEEMLHQCNCEIVEHLFDVVAEGQMKVCPQRTFAHSVVMRSLRQDNTSITDVYRLFLRCKKVSRYVRILKHPRQTIGKLLNKFKR